MAKKQVGFRKFNSSLKEVFSSEEFKALITYERTRSDRNGSNFSVIILNTQDKSEKSLKNVISKISRVNRSIDCIGWYEKDKIAIMLPDTDKDGAIIFGNKLMSELNLIKENIPFAIYTYPDNWLSNSNPTIISSSKVKNKSIELLFITKIPVWKRMLDIIGSLSLLLLTSPILLFVCLYIKVISPGPIFFTQTRIGYKGRPFKFWKFRSMKYDNNQSFHGKHSQSFIKNGDIPMEKLDNRDPRIILGGKILRKSCIDELPQLWNILKGEMSLVGPRPCIPYEANEYLRWHTHRFDTVPGLSGLWQVSGKNKLTFKQMIRLDIAYCNNMSLCRDLFIILKTPYAILKMVIEATLKRVNKEVDKTLSVQLENPKRKAL